MGEVGGGEAVDADYHCGTEGEWVDAGVEGYGLRGYSGHGEGYDVVWRRVVRVGWKKKWNKVDRRFLWRWIVDIESLSVR